MPSNFATPEAAAYNRNTLANTTRTQLGLPEAKTAWSVDERYNYNRRFAEFVASHPWSFTEQNVASANTFLQSDRGQSGYGAEQDDSFLGNLGAGADSIANDLRNAIPSIGAGALLLAGVAIVAFLYFNSKSVKAAVDSALPVAK